MLLVSIPAFCSVKIEQKLVNLAKKSPSKFQRVVITFSEPLLEAKANRYQKEEIIRFLQNRNRYSFQGFANELKLIPDSQNHIKLERSYWINNSLSARADLEGLKILTKISNVRKIYIDGKINYPVDVINSTSISNVEELNYAFTDTKRYDLMKEMPNVDGTGITIGSVDTGIDGKHPTFKDKIVRFYDASTKSEKPAFDADRHGTHTAGTMVGTKTDAGFEFGMAPGAKIIGTAALTGYSQMLEGMQWMLNPDKDPLTKDSPRAINNSWNCQGAPDRELFYKAIDAWEAAGILPVFSAGNSGPNVGTITPPHEHPLAFAVAATGEDGKVTSFSSRGPGKYKGQTTEKPDLAAPGNNVYSSVPGGTYSKMSGTSMAAPHVTGATALVLQVAPSLTPPQIRTVFLTTVKQIDGGTGSNGPNPNTIDEPNSIPPWNKEYGHGKLDILAAVKAAQQVSNTLLGLDMMNLDSVFGLNIQERTRTKLILNMAQPVEFEPSTFEENDDENFVTEL